MNSNDINNIASGHMTLKNLFSFHLKKFSLVSKESCALKPRDTWKKRFIKRKWKCSWSVQFRGGVVCPDDISCSHYFSIYDSGIETNQ